MNAQDFITAGQNNIQMLLKGQQVGAALVSNAQTQYADTLLKLKELQVRQDEAARERELRSTQFTTEQTRLKAAHEENLSLQRDSQKISRGNLEVQRYNAQRVAAEDAVTSKLKGAEATTAATRVRLAAATKVFTTQLEPLQKEQAKLQETLQRAGKLDTPGLPSSLSMLNRLGASVPKPEVDRTETRLAQVQSQINALTESHAKVEADASKSMADAIAAYGTVEKDSVVSITPMEPLPELSVKGDSYTTQQEIRPPDLPPDEPINNGQEANALPTTPTSGEPPSNILLPNFPAGAEEPQGQKGNTGPAGPVGRSSTTARAPRAVVEAMGPVVAVMDENYIAELIGLEPMTPEEEAAAQGSAQRGTIGVVLPPGMRGKALVKQQEQTIDYDIPAAVAVAPTESTPPPLPPQPPPVKYAGDFTRFTAHEHAQYHKDLELYKARASSAADTSEEGKLERAQALQIATQLEANVDKIRIDEQELPTTLQTLASEAGILSPQMAYRMASRNENPVVEMGKLQSEAHKAAVQMVSKSNLPAVQKNLLLRTYPKAVFDAYEGAFSKDGLVQPTEGFKDPITKTNISIEEVAVRDAFGATAADGKTPWRGFVEPDLGPPANVKPATVDVAGIFGVKKPVSGIRKPLVETRKDAAAQVGDADVSESPAPFGAAIKRDWWDGNTLSDEGEAQYRSALAEKVKDFSIPKIVERVRDLSADLGPKSPAISIPWESTRGGVVFSGMFGATHSGMTGSYKESVGVAEQTMRMSPGSLAYVEALVAKATSDTPEAPEAKAALIDLWTSLASRYAERKLEK